MASTIFSIDGTVTNPASALVVEPSLTDALFIVSTLSQLGFRVTVSDNFNEAKGRLLGGPALLVTALRLGAYNGLHLVLRGKSFRSDMAAVVISPTPDAVLLAEAERMGATLIVKGISAQDFRAAVCRTLFRGRESSAEPVRAPFERRRGNRRAAHSSAHDPERRAAERRRDIARLIQQTAAS